MPRVTRQSAKRLASSATSTPSTGPSPIVSNRVSVVGTETPNTSVTSDNDEGLKESNSKSRRNTRSKRRAEVDIIPADSDEGFSPGPATKRRVVARNVFVEIPVYKRAQERRKARASLTNSCFISLRSSKAIPQALTFPPKDKGKGKARAPQGSSPDTEEVQIASDYGLDYDETAPVVDESDGSGSEFVASEDEAVPEDEDEDEDEADEELMVDAAVRMSLQMANMSSNLAGSSSTQLAAPSIAAVLRAAAAERRLARGNKGVDVDDSHMDMDDGDDIDASSSESDDEPLVKRGKGKGKALAGKASRKVTLRDTSIPTHMTMRNWKKEQRRLLSAARRQNKKEELALMKELGRRLTHVSYSLRLFLFTLISIMMKAEKTTIALHKEHPELKDVWGDLEESIPIIVPTKAEQPASLKLTLLPFQRESLYWMRKQEQGVWRGGMLAVRASSYTSSID